MTAVAADFNDDGWPDLYVSNDFFERDYLYINNRNGTFTDVTFPAGLGLNTQYLGWGAMFFDFDNDTWPDLLLVNGRDWTPKGRKSLSALYRNNRNGTFTMKNRELGPSIIMDMAQERAPNGFDNIKDVIPHAELESIALSFKRAAGFDPQAVGREALSRLSLRFQPEARSVRQGEGRRGDWRGAHGARHGVRWVPHGAP